MHLRQVQSCLERILLWLVLAVLRLRFGKGVRPQTCKVCGRRDKFDFTVPDDIWEAVVPPTFQNRVVCLACFDAFAREKGISYAQFLHSLHFAGDKASFSFQVTSAIDITPTCSCQPFACLCTGCKTRP